MAHNKINEKINEVLFLSSEMDEDFPIVIKLISGQTIFVRPNEIVNIEEENCLMIKDYRKSYYIDYSDIIEIGI